MIIALAAVSVFGAIMSIVYSMFGGSKRGISMESRIQDFRSRAVSPEADEVDLELPFGERVLRPAIEGFSRTVSSVLPASMLSGIQKQLMMAGHPMTLQSYLTFWAVICATCTGAGLIMFVVLPGSFLIQKLLFVVMFGASNSDQKKAGQIAQAVQVAFRDLGVFTPSGKAVVGKNPAMASGLASRLVISARSLSRGSWTTSC